MISAQRLRSAVGICVLVALTRGATAQTAATNGNALMQDAIGFGNAYMKGDLRAAEMNALDAVARANQIKGHPEVLVTSLRMLATIYREEGRLGLAESTCSQAIDVSWKKLGPKNSHTAMALCEMGTISDAQHDYEEAEKYLSRARSICEGAKKLDSTLYADIINALGMVYTDEGKEGQAIELYNKAIAVSEREKGKDNADEACLLANLSLVFAKQGDFAKAEPVMRRAMDVTKSSGFGATSNALIAMNNLAYICHHQGRDSEAEAIYRSVITGCESKLGSNHRTTAVALDNLANLLEEGKRSAEAEPLATRALSIRERQLKPYDEEIAASCNTVGVIYCGERRFNEAMQVFLRAESLLQRSAGSSSTSLATVRANIATVKRALGNG